MQLQRLITQTGHDSNGQQNSPLRDIAFIGLNIEMLVLKYEAKFVKKQKTFKTEYLTQQ